MIGQRLRLGIACLLGVLLIGSISGLESRNDSPSADAREGIEQDQLAPNLASSTGACGVERWAVKTGTDADAGLVNTGSVTPTTIATMRSFAKPASLPSNSRIQPQETTVYTIDATLTEYKLETDSDYHIVIKDGAGNSMITEIPDPACAGGSLFLSSIQSARNEFDARLTATTSFKTASIPVRVRGVGFFDFLHGQTGVAPNGIELHPVFDIAFNPPPPVPVVASVSPSGGPMTGGTAVTIGGSNFASVDAVTFGSTPAATYSVVNSSEIDATSPPGSGTVDVTVTTSVGTSSTSGADLFTYIQPQPTVTSVVPDSGPLAGGVPVTINGTNFVNVTGVAFGDLPAAGFTAAGATKILATPPAGSGTVDVRVTTTAGTSPTNAADRFTYGRGITQSSPTPPGDRTVTPIPGASAEPRVPSEAQPRSGPPASDSSRRSTNSASLAGALLSLLGYQHEMLTLQLVHLERCFR